MTMKERIERPSLLVFNGWIGYKWLKNLINIRVRVRLVGKRGPFLLFALIFMMLGGGATLHAQTFPKTLIFLYSNNIQGEIEPCPT